MSQTKEQETVAVLSGTSPDKRGQLVEVAVFLLLIVPSMILSFFLVHQGSLSFDLTAWATMLRDFGLVLLIFYFLWRNGEPRAAIGWIAGGGVLAEVVLGALAFLVLTSSAGMVEQYLQKSGASSPSTPVPHFLQAQGWSEFVLATVLVLVVAVAEEAIFRGYLILRLKSVTGSTAAAVILSSAIFALGHGYEGTAGMVTVGFMGLLFALVYVWRKRLVPP